MGCSRSDYYDRLEAMDEDLKLKALKSLTYREIRRKVIDDQTIMFWNLQLQFMEMDRFRLGCMVMYYMGSGVYQSNEYTNKISKLSDKARWLDHSFTQDEHECLATHLALQLSGLA